MNDEPKQIRFLDSEYRVLFAIQDEDSITITAKSGKKASFVCRYEDDFHTQIGKRTYEMSDFAEKMEQKGAAYAPTIPLYLPDWCYAVLPSSGEMIRVELDACCYRKLDGFSSDPRENSVTAEKLNLELGVYPQQAAAMLGGLMFGWDTPAARVSSYNMQGEPLPQAKQKKAAVSQVAEIPSQSPTETDFLRTPSDAFAIYQLKSGDSTRDLRFEPLVRLQLTGMAVDRANYECVYAARLPANAPKVSLSLLEAIYKQFNLGHPASFTGHSLSVSDVVALKHSGQMTCHYIDRWGFAEIPNFLSTAKQHEKPSIEELLKPKLPSQEPVSKAPKKNIRRDNER